MLKIKYVKGDLFDNIVNQQNTDIVICHIVNNIHCWGSGFVIPLAKHFPEAKARYLSSKKLVLGDVQYVHCLNGQENTYIWVANMIAQNGIMSRSTGNREFVNDKPIRYASLVKCLEEINVKCKDMHILAPAFGSDLAGGNWPMIAELVEEILTDVKSVTIFYLDDNQKEKMKKGLTVDI